MTEVDQRARAPSGHMAALIAAEVQRAPRLTPEQIDTVSALLRPPTIPGEQP